VVQYPGAEDRKKSAFRIINLCPPEENLIKRRIQTVNRQLNPSILSIFHRPAVELYKIQQAKP